MTTTPTNKVTRKGAAPKKPPVPVYEDTKPPIAVEGFGARIPVHEVTVYLTDGSSFKVGTGFNTADRARQTVEVIFKNTYVQTIEPDGSTNTYPLSSIRRVTTRVVPK